MIKQNLLVLKMCQEVEKEEDEEEEEEKLVKNI